MDEAEKRLGLAAASLDALSPLAVLQRGYAIAQNEDGKTAARCEVGFCRRFSKGKVSERKTERARGRNRG